MTEEFMADDPAVAELLFTPLSINELTLTNRIIMSPMAALEAHADGRASEQTIAFLSDKGLES
jgi:2,4-dienoyl-CoA reductase-like NADH-dependent reductase (Old Yellow Enzyme family)